MLTGLLSCAGIPAPAAPVRDPTTTTELGIFMKTRINPAFSKISFLLFHDDDGEPEADPSVLLASANELALAADGLAGWPELPGESEQSKLVFREYADSLRSDTGKLAESLRGNQMDHTRRLFESLHQKCDACHHFFRYEPASTPSPW